MDFICLESVVREDDENSLTSRRFDYSLYFSVKNEGEEMKLKKIMKKYFNFNFKFLNSNPYKELIVFLPNTTKSKALEFSSALRKKMKHDKPKQPKEKVMQKPELEPIIPTRFLAITGFKTRETLSVFDDKHNVLFEIKNGDFIIGAIKKLIGGEDNGKSEKTVS